MRQYSTIPKLDANDRESRSLYECLLIGGGCSNSYSAMTLEDIFSKNLIALHC